MVRFPLARPARLAVFASGSGTNFQALVEAFPPQATRDDASLGSVSLLISDKTGAFALERARRAGVPGYAVPWPKPRGRAAFEAEASDLLERFDIDVVCLAGFMRILSPDFVRAWRGRIVNIHPSLLPEFPGLHAQRQALEAGVLESGCTVHFVDEGVDTGAPIVQRRVPVLDDDDVAALSARIRTEEHRAYPEAVARVLRGEATLPAPADAAGAATPRSAEPA